MAIVIPQQSRLAGTYQGTLSQAGITIPPGATQIEFVMPMSQADIDDTRNTLVYHLEGDWGNGWENIYGPADWAGGYPIKPGTVRQPPTFRYSTSARPMPNDMRGTATTTRRWAWGLDIMVS